ncbi:hypothetical protein B0O80DRAFT_86357 [Mortierella sp. GBAus27b]|nr:hypothetical protein BGX31_003215 [Mortierella sp. GBA43]KAI8352339.1 hypothetical protein B0O80DRAFT_86357 [Mortierella sp. GBAus27b]
MLNIPEIDEMICRELCTQDLVQCARVNKQWNRIVTPSLWRDLSWLDFASDKQMEAFRTLVLGDYLRDQRLQTGRGTREGVQTRWSRHLASLAVLSKYGSCIQHLPHPQGLLKCFQPLRHASQLRRKFTGMGKEPSAHDLIRHLFRKCPTSKIKYVAVNKWDFFSEDFIELVFNFVLPRTRHLYISSVKCHHPLPARKIIRLLDHCSTNLEQLTISAYISHDDNDDIYGLDQEEPKSPMNIKRLNLLYCGDGSCSRAFWTWLWRLCSQVESMRVWMIGDIVHSLTDGMLTYMPNLNEIDFGLASAHSLGISNEDLAALISGSRKGWKILTLRNTEDFGGAAMKALTQHVHTLEKLIVEDRNDDFMRNLIRMIPRCHSLHTLIMVDERKYGKERCTCFDVNMLIDQDPFTKTLRPWECERSLKTLMLQIGGIPRPDLTEDEVLERDVVKEKYPGQGRDIQGRVYDRLGRLVNLETLWLKDTSNRENGIFGPFLGCPQTDCLEMSLESGLWKMSGLKALRELNVASMRTRIGVKEVQWMTEHWPKLRLIYGIQFDHEAEALEWLQQHHPRIEVRAAPE